MSDDRAAPRAALFWFAAIAAAVAAFVYWNDPLRWAAMRLQPIAAAALFLAACCGFGWLARAPGLLTSAAIGCGIVGGASFAAALLHLLRPATFIAILAAGLVLFVIAMFRVGPPPSADVGLADVGPPPAAANAGPVRTAEGGGPTHSIPEGGGPTHSIPEGGGRALAMLPLLRCLGERRHGRRTPEAIAILAVIFVLILPFVAAPDVSTDALEYHLLVPKLTIQQNAIRYQPLLVESNYPGLAEYDFIPLLILGDARVAKAFHFLCALLLLFAVGRLARANGLLAAAIFFSMPIAALTSGWAWNDMLFTLFVVLSLVHLIEERFVVAGILFGFATWTKYTFVLAGIALAAILFRGLIQRWWRARDVVRFAVPVVLIAAIWMTKNAVLTGNPVYPFLNGIFHSPFWSAASDRYLHATLTHYEILEWHWWTWFAFPVMLTLKPRVIDVQTGILPLVLLPLFFFGSRDRTASIVRTYVVAIVIGWLMVRTEARSLLSLFAVLSAIYAANIERLRGWRVIVGAAVALNAVIMLVTTHIITDPVRYFLGLESPSQYIVRMDPKQEVYRWIDAQPDARAVLLVGLHDPFYLDKPALFSSCCDTPVAQTIDPSTLKQSGITHIAFRPREYELQNAAGLYSWNAAQKLAFEDFLRQHCRLVTRIGDVLLFRVM